MSAQPSPASASNTEIAKREHRDAASYERELARQKCTEVQLRAALSHDEDLLREKDQTIQLQDMLGKESDHRLLNGMQMIASLLSLQSRATSNAEVAAQLSAASNRVGTIARVHRRLHNFDGSQTIAFKQFVADLCRDFSTMLSPNGAFDREIVIEGVEVNLPAAIGIPLGFIVNELITNAAKYGSGRITVSLQPHPAKGYALSVANNGPVLPEGFDPARCKGLGMKIVRGLVGQIGGEIHIGRADNNQGTRFTVLFSCDRNRNAAS